MGVRDGERVRRVQDVPVFGGLRLQLLSVDGADERADLDGRRVALCLVRLHLEPRLLHRLKLYIIGMGITRVAKRRRVTFYVRRRGKRRKKVSFLSGS